MATAGPTSRGSSGGTETAEFQDYWHEVEDIELSCKEPEGDTGSSEDELDQRTPDEGEEAADWLQNAGYGELVDRFLGGQDIDDELLEDSDLTKTQRQTIKRRINTLKSTINKKYNKVPAKTDVRDIFSRRKSSPSSDQRASRDSVGSQGDGAPHHAAVSQQGSTSPLSQRVSRNLSLLKRRTNEYNMGAGVADTSTGVETLSIQTSAGSRMSRDRYSSSGSDDLLLSQQMAPPVSDYDISVSVSHSDLMRNKSPKSPRSFMSGMPSSPMSLSSSSPSSTASPSWRETSLHDLSAGLPPLSIQPDNLGITNIDDLSPADIAKLRPLALLELTTLFDQCRITYGRRKVKKRLKESGQFGVPLQALLEQDQKKNSHLRVPLVFQELISFLEKEAIEEEGILRVPGSVMRIKSLRKEIDDKFASGRFSWEDVRPNDAAGLLKQFLRDLPSPLLTPEYVEAFAQVEQIPVFNDQIQALKLLVLMLPEVNRDTFKSLLRFLKTVVRTENKMTVNNVAMIMAPNLFLMQAGRSQSKAIKDSEFRMAAGTANIVRMMMHYQDILWVVPTTMIQQMRHQNETEFHRRSKDSKSIMKFLGRKDKSDNYKKPQIMNEKDFNMNIIKVQVPSMNKFHTAKQLDITSTAGEIVSQCLHDIAGPRNVSKLVSAGLMGHLNGRRGSSGDEIEDNANNRNVAESALFEVGGNIGERRLHKDTRVLEVLKVNPNAEWIIKLAPSSV